MVPSLRQRLSRRVLSSPAPAWREKSSLMVRLWYRPPVIWASSFWARWVIRGANRRCSSARA